MSQVLVRTSERAQFKRCRQSWWWSYVDRLKPLDEATPLRFGTLIHKALEARYPKGTKRGPHPAETFAALYAEAVADRPFRRAYDEHGEPTLDIGDLGVAMMEGYVREYGEDSRYTVLASEQTFQVPVHNRRGQYLYTYVGTLDGVWRDEFNADVLFQDFKTAASISVTHLPLDEQAGAYFTFAPEDMVRRGLLKKGQLPTQILYTFMRKGLPDARERNAQGHYLNKDGSVSKKQPPPLFHREIVYRNEHDRAAVRQRAKAEVRDMLQVRRQPARAYKNPGPFTCMGCSYKDMCELHETGADWQALRDGTMRPWDPYDAHEIEDDEKL